MVINLKKFFMMNNIKSFTYLNFIAFQEFSTWDVKKYLSASIKSNFLIEKLGKYIQEENNRVFPKKHPEKDFEILGVNNKTGIFDAYIQKGKEIKQPYKILQNGFLAYNPYRINVGSIGLKMPIHEYKYISPAYVVFSCKKDLSPEFLFLMFKTERFNKIIKDNTTGSVRQNLSFTNLSNIEIPLPTIQIQEELVLGYQNKIQLAEQLENEAYNLKNELDFELGISNIKIESNAGKLNFVDFKLIEKWGLDQIFKSHTKYNGKFKTVKVIEICSVGSGGTPSRNNKSYYNGNIPWIKTGEVLDEIIVDTEEKITSEAIKNSSAKLYPKGSLIIAMYGQGKTRGRTAKLGIDATTNQACAVLFNINNEIVITDYLWIYLMNEYDRMRELATGNNQPNLNADMIKNYPVVIPPMDIQLKIIEEYNIIKNKQNQNLQNAEALRKEAISNFEKAIFN